MRVQVRRRGACLAADPADGDTRISALHTLAPPLAVIRITRITRITRISDVTCIIRVATAALHSWKLRVNPHPQHKSEPNTATQGMDDELDPLSTLALLGLLAHMPIGTKIAISNNRVRLEEPTAAGWLWRTCQHHLLRRGGYSRNCLHRLQVPVSRAVLWYGDRVGAVTAQAVRGLNMLLCSYRGPDDGNVATTIRQIIASAKGAPLAGLADRGQADRELLARIAPAWPPADVNLLQGMFERLSHNDTNYVSCVQCLINGKAGDLDALLKSRPSDQTAAESASATGG